LIVSSCLLLYTCISSSEAFCWQIGHNPSFNAAPIVEQVTLSKVRVSWKGIVNQRNCVDQFLVKYWQTSMPQGYETTELVSSDVNFVEVVVSPKVPYNFQAVAREDKGPIRGVDWNKSPIVKFRTSRLNEQVEDEPPPAPETDLVTHPPYPLPSSTPSPLQERGQKGVVIANITVEVLAIILVCGFIVILLFIGLIYKCFRRKSIYDSTEQDDDVVSGGSVALKDDDDVEAGEETEELKARTDE